MLLSAPPLLHALRLKRLFDDVDGEVVVLRERTHRSAAQVWSLGLAAVGGELELTMRSRPPRSKMAPPPPPSKSCPLELPSVKARFSITSLGEDWSWQCEVVHTCAGSQVSM